MDFSEKFKAEGPACVGTDLDKGLVNIMVHVQVLFCVNCVNLPGVQLMKEFQAEYSKYESQRQELTNAEKLFDLPITLFPGLVEVDKELRNMAKVYELYEAQKVYMCAIFTSLCCYA